jgi:hypothetical protein
MEDEPMRTLLRTFGWLLMASLAMPVAPLQAQCGGGVGGGHDHGATAGRNEKRISRTIDRLLADEQGRAHLMESVLRDEEFLRVLVEKMSQVPQWRALAAEAMGLPLPALQGEAGHEHGSPVPVLYTCPMHPEVSSGNPGKCSKCGMTLERKAP